jgi:acetyltransferase
LQRQERRVMTYLIDRYPAELIDIVHSPGGTRILVRPVLPQDAELIQAFFQGLSPQSRRNRFFRTVVELPASLLRSFTSIDYHDHLALLASVLVDGEEVAIAEARYILSREGAEFALAVADHWQGQGIGRLLLERLECRAASEGVNRLYAEVLPANAPMLRLAMKAGFALAQKGGDGVLRVEKALTVERGLIESVPYVPTMAA